MTLERLQALAESKGRAPLDGTPLICLEVNPPRGIDASAIFERLDKTLEGVDFLNVTDSALARMKCASLPFASILKARYGIEPLVNLSCRDRNLIALQGDLLAAWMLGVRSVVALTGDALSIGDFPQGKGVFEVNSIGLLNAIQKLRAGQDYVGNSLKGSPSFCPGVVLNPNAKNPAAEIKRLQKKADAGAQYALSQPVFDPELARSFFAQASQVGIPLMVGLLPFKNAIAARAFTNVPGIKLSDEILRELEGDEGRDLSDLSIEHCHAVANGCKDYVAGIHVVSGTAPKLGMRLVHELARRFK